MRKPWLLFVLGVILVLGGSALAWKVQTAGGIKVTEVTFPGAGGTPMSALLYVPKNATAATPAPGVLAVHGYINSRETQSGFAIEFARRGYVVLALDQTGHGYSGGAAFSNGFGGPDGLNYLRGLKIVDPKNIGLEGHSMGGWTVLAAAATMPDAYKAVVLEGSSTGKPFAADGTPTWPRNLALVYSRYDEFSKLMWGVDKARDVTSSAKLQAVFGATGAIEPGRVYGSVADGTARRLSTPATTHPGDHISPTAIGHALDWFALTLTGGTPRPAGDQIWMWKEAGTGVALIGAVVLLLGTFELLLALPLFAPLRHAPQPTVTQRDKGWWGAMAITAILPALTYFPLFILGMLALKPNAILKQGITNQVLTWAVLGALLTLALGAIGKRDKPVFTRQLPLSILIGVASITVLYGALAGPPPVPGRFPLLGGGAEALQPGPGAAGPGLRAAIHLRLRGDPADPAGAHPGGGRQRRAAVRQRDPGAQRRLCPAAGPGLWRAVPDRSPADRLRPVVDRGGHPVPAPDRPDRGGRRLHLAAHRRLRGGQRPLRPAADLVHGGGNRDPGGLTRGLGVGLQGYDLEPVRRRRR